jgi:hypothetical protein
MKLIAQIFLVGLVTCVMDSVVAGEERFSKKNQHWIEMREIPSQRMRVKQIAGRLVVPADVFIDEPLAISIAGAMLETGYRPNSDGNYEITVPIIMRVLSQAKERLLNVDVSETLAESKEQHHIFCSAKDLLSAFFTEYWRPYHKEKQQAWQAFFEDGVVLSKDRVVEKLHAESNPRVRIFMQLLWHKKFWHHGSLGSLELAKIITYRGESHLRHGNVSKRLLLNFDCLRGRPDVAVLAQQIIDCALIVYSEVEVLWLCHLGEMSSLRIVAPLLQRLVIVGSNSIASLAGSCLPSLLNCDVNKTGVVSVKDFYTPSMRQSARKELEHAVACNKRRIVADAR